jgi:hypothetical protein
MKLTEVKSVGDFFKFLKEKISRTTASNVVESPVNFSTLIKGQKRNDRPRYRVYQICPANQDDRSIITRRQARYTKDKILLYREIQYNKASNTQTSQICDDKDKKMTTNNKKLAKKTVTFNDNSTTHTVNRYIKEMQCYT